MFKNNQSKIKYEDIINMPHHVSNKRPHMPVGDRAAQFAPFAALTGHDEAVQETARLTDSRVELDENEIEIINEKLRLLLEQIDQQPEASVTYFVSDIRKTGGAYRTIDCPVKRFREYDGILVMSDGTEIPVIDILEINLK